MEQMKHYRVKATFTLLDTDGDGVGDAWDACPGWDDRIDVDGDGPPANYMKLI